MRLFLGIPLADVVVHELKTVTSRLRSYAASSTKSLHWTTPESWHITLQFLGNATEAQLECLTARLGELRSAPVPVQLRELGCFDRAGIIFADVAVAPELTALRQKVLDATTRCGFVAQELPYHPHITLLRAKGRNHGFGLRDLTTGMRFRSEYSGFLAHEFLLYESHLGRNGSRYEVRGRFPLNSRQ